MPVKYTNVWADFSPKNFGGRQVTWNEWASIVLLQYLLFCLFYVRLVRPVFILRCECCVTVLGWKCGANVFKEYIVFVFQLFRDQVYFWWYSCMYSDSQQFINLTFLHAFTNSIIRSCSPYSCLLSRICSAYADWGLFVRIYQICSLYMVSGACQSGLYTHPDMYCR